MKAEGKVGVVYRFRTRCVAIPVKGSHLSKISRYAILLGLNAHPSCVGEGDTPDDAWADAARRIEAAKKGSHG